MPIGDPASKETTYGEIEDIVRLRTGTIDDPRLSPSLMLKEISLSIQKINGILNGATAPFNLTTNTTITITGTANPYIMDLSGISPYLDRIVRLVHITAALVRTRVDLVSPEEAEDRQALTNIYGNSIWGVWEGDAIRLYRGNSFTVTPATDTTELKYYRQSRVVGATRSTRPDIVDKYVSLVILDVIGKIFQYKNNGMLDSNTQNAIDKGVQDIYREFSTQKQLEIEAKL